MQSEQLEAMTLLDSIEKRKKKRAKERERERFEIERLTIACLTEK